MQKVFYNLERVNKLNNNKKGFHYAWIILIALSIIVGLGKGTINNSSGLFLSPVAKDLGIDMGSLTLYFSISAIMTMLFLPVAGKLMAKYSPRLIIVAAILLQSGSFALFGLMRSVWGWYALSVPMSIGGTLIAVVVGPVLINQWFKQKKWFSIRYIKCWNRCHGRFITPNDWKTNSK